MHIAILTFEGFNELDSHDRARHPEPREAPRLARSHRLPARDRHLDERGQVRRRSTLAEARAPTRCSWAAA
jgi:hypothetical protein